MTNHESGQFFTRLLALSELFDAKFSEAKGSLYFEALRDLPLERVIQAMNEAVKICKFMPRPAEIRTLALGDSEDRAEIAWVSFRQAMKRAGSYASLSVADAALGESIIAMFGSWPAACAQELSPEMWSSKRKEFGRVYRVICQRNLDGSRYLPGICEQQNTGRGDWMKFVPVHRLGPDGLSSQLTLEEANQERQQIAASSSGFSQLRDSLPRLLRLVDPPLDETG